MVRVWPHPQQLLTDFQSRVARVCVQKRLEDKLRFLIVLLFCKYIYQLLSVVVSARARETRLGVNMFYLVDYRVRFHLVVGFSPLYEPREPAARSKF